MDSIAEGGVRFDRAYSVQPLCCPFRTALQFGRYPTENRITSNVRRNHKMKLPPHPLIGRMMRDHGYESAYFGKWHVFIRPDQSTFDIHGYKPFNHEVYGYDAVCPEDVRKWLETRDNDKPFFLTASFHNPHDVCQLVRDQKLPEGPIPSLSAAGKLPPLPENFDIPAGYPTAALEAKELYKKAVWPTADWSERRWREYLWGYYRLVEKVDRHVGETLQALKDTGYADNTVVVFVSDHGEGLAAHHWNQKLHLAETSVKIPFIVKWPGVTESRVESALVSPALDMYPTLCEIGGFAPPSTVRGKSLAGLLKDPSAGPDRDHLILETEFALASTSGIKGRAVRTDRFKYMQYNRGEHAEWLVDMQQDPGETVNLADNPKYEAELQRHRKLLDAWCREVGTGWFKNLDEVRPEV